MRGYIFCCASFGIYGAFQNGGAAFGFFIMLLIALCLRLLAFDNKLAENNPRWLGSGDSDFAPPSILDMNAQAIVAHAANKITKTDDDKYE